MTVGSPFSLDGMTAVITGGATGLGLGMTEAFVSAGARVVVLSRNPSDELARFGDAVHHIPFDVTDTAAAPDVAAMVQERFGPVDVLVNNAGNHRKKLVDEMTVEDFTDVLDVHLVGAFALSKAFLPTMRSRRSGSLLFIGSMTSYIGMPAVTGYSAAKSGILGVMRALAAEAGPDGVRVNAIAPGWIDTAMFRKATDDDPERLRKILGRTPMERVGTPSDIGLAAVYLSSPAASFVTGVCLPVDGGALVGF
ncbi:SDR family NAD(P)-dependent oxidoreductase [Tessaracoccus terricola]